MWTNDAATIPGSSEERWRRLVDAVETRRPTDEAAVALALESFPEAIVEPLLILLRSRPYRLRFEALCGVAYFPRQRRIRLGRSGDFRAAWTAWMAIDRCFQAPPLDLNAPALPPPPQENFAGPADGNSAKKPRLSSPEPRDPALLFVPPPLLLCTLSKTLSPKLSWMKRIPA